MQSSIPSDEHNKQPAWLEFYLLRPDRLNRTLLPAYLLQQGCYLFLAPNPWLFGGLLVFQSVCNVALGVWATRTGAQPESSLRAAEGARFVMNLVVTSLFIYFFASSIPVWSIAITGALAYSFIWPERIRVVLYGLDCLVFSTALLLSGASSANLVALNGLYLIAAMHSSTLMTDILGFAEKQRRAATDLQRQLLLTAEEHARAESLNQDLHDANLALDRLTRYDALTSVLNRRGLDSSLTEDDECRREPGPEGSALVLVDCDDFKAVNTAYGHAGGDRVLVEVATRLRFSLREGDHLARVGGDEFLIVMPRTSLDHATATAERLRTSISSLPIDTGDGLAQVTVSLSVAQMDSGPNSISELLRTTRAGLEASKGSGKNRVSVSRPSKSA